MNEIQTAEPSKGGARVSSGKDSKQDYETPWKLIWAIEEELGVKFGVDLAAVEKNKKAPLYIGPEEDSLKTDWKTNGTRFCRQCRRDFDRKRGRTTRNAEYWRNYRLQRGAA